MNLIALGVWIGWLCVIVGTFGALHSDPTTNWWHYTLVSGLFIFMTTIGVAMSD